MIRMDVGITFCKEVQLRDPYLICGLPGIGYVAKLVTDYLIEKLKAEVFGEVHSAFFPPYVLIKKDGVVEVLKNELYYWRNEAAKRDLILFTGSAQASSPEGQYLIAEEVLNVAKRFGVRRLYSIAAYLTDKRVEKPKVYGVATEPHLVEELKKDGVLVLDEGSIGGTNGLMVGLAETKKIQGICLLGETQGYRTPSGNYVVDAQAARSVLEVLTKMLDIHIDMTPIEDQAKLSTEFLERIEEVEHRVMEQISKAAPTDRYIT